MADVLTPGHVFVVTHDKAVTQDKGHMDPVPDPKPIEIPLQCEYAIVIGANEVAYSLALELQDRGWNPLLLGTQEIFQSYWCNEFKVDEQLQKQHALRDKIEASKLKIVPNNFIQDIEHSHSKTVTS